MIVNLGLGKKDRRFADDITGTSTATAIPDAPAIIQTGTSFALNPNDKNVTALPIPKSLWSSAKIWDYDQFVAAYPNLKLSLMVETFKEWAWQFWDYFFSPNDWNGFDRYAFDQACEVFHREMEYIIAPNQPLEIDFESDLSTFCKKFCASYATSYNATYKMNYIPNQSDFYTMVFDLARLSNTFGDNTYGGTPRTFKALTPGITSSIPIVPTSVLSNTTSGPYSAAQVEFIPYMYALFVLDLILPNALKNSATFYYPKDKTNVSGFNLGTSGLMSYVRAKRDYLISTLPMGILGFTARSEAGYIVFNEIYGQADISKIPAKTISYVVTNDPLPFAFTGNISQLAFWSRLFASDVGMSLLNAVASLYPVEINTLLDWNDPSDIQKITQETSSATITHFLITYIFSDIDITIDTKQSILVQYKRQKVNEQYQYSVAKDSIFSALMPFIFVIVAGGVCFFAASAAAAAGAGGGAVAGGAADTTMFNSLYASTYGSMEASVDTSLIGTVSPSIVGVTAPVEIGSTAGLSIGGVASGAAETAGEAASVASGASNILGPGVDGGAGASTLTELGTGAKLTTGVLGAATAAKALTSKAAVPITTPTTALPVSQGSMFGNIPIKWILIGGAMILGYAALSGKPPVRRSQQSMQSKESGTNV